MLTLVMMLAVAQVSPAAAASSNPTPTVDDRPGVDAPARSAGLFDQPRVGGGVLVGRMAMGLLGFALTAVPVAALLVVAAYSGLPTVALVGGVILWAGLMGLGTAVGAALFGKDYGRDFVDALVASMGCAGAGALLFLVGFFVPVLLAPLLAVAGTLMVVGVPLFVQAFKRSDAPEATVALLHF